MSRTRNSNASLLVKCCNYPSKDYYKSIIGFPPKKKKKKKKKKDKIKNKKNKNI